MKPPLLPTLPVLALAAGCLLTQSASALITIETVNVGDIGNPNDSTGYGGVGYSYGIGTYEVTLNQYTAFLNAVAATDTWGLYNTDLGLNPSVRGIARSGTSGSYTYSVIGSGNRPVTYVSWYDAARFVNWLQNGQPTGLQTAGTTETGAYTLTGNSGVIFRNANWNYGLPSENEWYKAAYYQPAAQGGDGDGYWAYPTANNTIPNSRNGSASDPNSGNFYRDDGIANGFNGGFAIPPGGSLTDVGAFSLADSFYGTFDQGGNVAEWNDGVISGSARIIRGGGFYDSEVGLRASMRTGYSMPNEDAATGFRIVVIPEPGVLGLAALAGTMFFWRRRVSR